MVIDSQRATGHFARSRSIAASCRFRSMVPREVPRANYGNRSSSGPVSCAESRLYLATAFQGIGDVLIPFFCSAGPGDRDRSVVEGADSKAVIYAATRNI